MDIRLWIDFLIDFESNYVTLSASINFIQNWKSIGGENNWLNRDLVFISFILRGSWMIIVSTKIQDQKNPRSQFWFAQLPEPFFDFGDNKLWNGFLGCNLSATFHVLGIFLCDGSHCKISESSPLIFLWELGDDVYRAYWFSGGRRLIGTGGSRGHVFKFPQQYVLH